MYLVSNAELRPTSAYSIAKGHFAAVYLSQLLETSSLRLFSVFAFAFRRIRTLNIIYRLHTRASGHK